jgi:hypothetical protein
LSPRPPRRPGVVPTEFGLRVVREAYGRNTEDHWPLRYVTTKMPDSIRIWSGIDPRPKEAPFVQCLEETLKGPTALKLHVRRVKWRLIPDSHHAVSAVNAYRCAPNLPETTRVLIKQLPQFGGGKQRSRNS